MGYQRTALMGLGYVTSARVITEVVKFIKLFWIARLLHPTTLGIFGAAFLTYSFLEVFFQLGTDVILLQKKPEEARAFLNSVWTVNVLKGAVLAGIVLASLPIANLVYSVPIPWQGIVLMAVVPLIRGCASSSVVLSQKKLAFNKTSAVSVGTVFFQTLVAIGILSVSPTLEGLFMIAIVEACSEVAASWIFFSPRPRWEWQPDLIRIIFGQAKWMNITNITTYIFHQFDDFVVGKLLGAYTLGVYQMAYTIGMAPVTHSAQLVSQVTLPTFSLFADDQKRLRRAFYRTLAGLTALTIFPSVVFFVWGQQLVSLAFGEQWLSIFPMVYVLLWFGIIRGISGLSATLLFAVNKEKWVSSITVASCVTLLITIYPLVQWYGALGGAYAALCGAIASLPFMIYYTQKVLYDTQASR